MKDLKINLNPWIRNQIMIEKLLYSSTAPSELVELPENIFEWMKVARPKVAGRERSLRIAPFWRQIYADTSTKLMVLGGRQIYKSTYATDVLANAVTSHSFSQAAYITFSDKSLGSFSKQRLQGETFKANPVLNRYLKTRNPGIQDFALANGSTIYLRNHVNEYKNVEGLSPILCVCDEAQYLDIANIGKVYQTMAATQGKMRILGIGGEEGSPYERLWKSTNQQEWVYDDPNWRDKLEFNSAGLVVDDYLEDVLKGRWVAKNPEVTDFPGYHIPRTLMPDTALTKLDAVEKYKKDPVYSLEGYLEQSPELYTTHVLASFHSSARRPITHEMVMSCIRPYHYLQLLEAEEVVELKRLYGNDIKVAMGVDFGSGRNSKTAIAIMILWKKNERIQLAHIEQRPQEDHLYQSQYITELFKIYRCDFGVGDLGYGEIQVKLIQEGGVDQQTGQRYSGVGISKFVGSRTIADETNPFQRFDEEIDEHGKKAERIHIDKSATINTVIEILERKIVHPGYPEDKRLARQQFMIPGQNVSQLNFLVNDLTSITRKDLTQLQGKIDDIRQNPRKEYNHPPDTVMALAYALRALRYEERWNWVKL